jgi:hypothetical protein
MVIISNSDIISENSGNVNDNQISYAGETMPIPVKSTRGTTRGPRSLGFMVILISQLVEKIMELPILLD